MWYEIEKEDTELIEQWIEYRNIREKLMRISDERLITKEKIMRMYNVKIGFKLFLFNDGHIAITLSGKDFLENDYYIFLKKTVHEIGRTTLCQPDETQEEIEAHTLPLFYTPDTISRIISAYTDFFATFLDNHPQYKGYVNRLGETRKAAQKAMEKEIIKANPRIKYKIYGSFRIAYQSE